MSNATVTGYGNFNGPEQFWETNKLQQSILKYSLQVKNLVSRIKLIFIFLILTSELLMSYIEQKN